MKQYLTDTASAALATLILSTLLPKLPFLLYSKPELTSFNLIALVKLLKCDVRDKHST